MSRSIDPLVVGKVIGDVIDLFVPSVTMTVLYGEKPIHKGCNVKPSIASEPPTVLIDGRPNELFTLVMTDPDAPSPSEPTMREWLHWIVMDIRAGSDISRGRVIVDYMGPRPPIGIHRYVFVLFRQSTPSSSTVLHIPRSTRANFNTRAFATGNNLGLPVAAIFFNAQKEPGTRKA